MFKATRATKTACIAGLFAFLLAFADLGFACSRIFWNTNGQAAVVARSMDWNVSFGDRLVLNPRGEKVRGWPGRNSATWVSRYGSLTVVPYEFSQALRQDPDGPGLAKGADPLLDGSSEGMNEKGLSIHLLALGAAKYTMRDNGKPRVHPSRLLRYVLDTCGTVREAVDALRAVQVVPAPAEEGFPQHLALDDATGDSAIIEFLGSGLVVHHGREFTVLTNDPPYPDQLANLKRYKAFGGSLEEIPGGIEPQERFVRAAFFLKTLPEPKDAAEAVAYLQSVIRNVSVPFGALYRSLPGAATYPTWWTSVSDLKNRVFHFSMTRAMTSMRVDLGTVDFSAATPRSVLDPAQSGLEGDVTSAFMPVSPGQAAAD